MPASPTVSVIIPVRNGERFVEQAISSVLAQTFTRFRMVVVDDGSTDGSAGVASGVVDPRVQVIQQYHCGAAAARNLGVRVSDGELVGFLDADDLWVKEKLEWQVAALARHPGIGMVFGHYAPFHGGDAPDPEVPAVPGFSSGTMLVRRDVLQSVGPFPTNWRVGEFIDWYARARDLGTRELVLPRTVMYRRVHGDNLGVRLRDSRIDYARVLSAVIKRRRQRP